MFDQRDALYARELRRDALAAAEKDRLIRQAQAARAQARISYRLGMARLGARLVAWGEYLQTRYASPSLRGAA